ncbi:MAG: T9SS type A sorting domain-containing protein, partial [Daejeonella sp.]
VIYFDDFAQTDFETQLDALKLLNTDASVPNFYSVSSDKKNLSINALPLSADSVTHIPLGLKTELSENVEFSIDDVEKIPYRFNIYILDKKNNSLQDMRQHSKFSTYQEKGKSENRFELILSSKTGSYNLEPASSLKANYNEGKLQYSLAGISENQSSKMVISNMSGQILGTQIFRGSGTQQFQIRLNPGIYIINTISEIGSVSNKISVN